MGFKVIGESRETASKFNALSKERKALQKEGKLPAWYTTQAWQMFKAKYMVEGEEAVLGRHRTIARTLAAYMPGAEAWEEKFFNLMWDGILSPASPVLANTGTDKGMPVSCSGQYVGDSVESFYKGLYETAVLSKYGFGCSADFSDIRARGTPISRGGEANGPVPVIDDFFTCASKISQGGARRGSTAAYIDIEHPDFDEAISSLEVAPDGKNYGWIVRDSFTQALVAGDPVAMAKFQKVVHVKLVTGKGYLFFIDKVNRQRPQSYVDQGLDVRASNLCCVAGDQRVVTDRGIKTVAELYASGGSNTVMGLDGASSAGPMLLPRPDAPMVRIETAEGYTHKVTPDHRVWKRDNGWTEAQHLEPGDQLLIQQGEGLFGSTHEPELAFIAGLVAGDGTYADESVCIDLWPGKTVSMAVGIESLVAKIIDGRALRTTSTDQPKFSGNGKLRLCSKPLADALAERGFTGETKLDVPKFVWEGTRETVAHYLHGLYVTDGNVQVGADATSVVLASTSLQLLQDLQILWANLGVKSSISRMHDGGERDFGADRGGVYETQPVWRLAITSIKGSKIAQEITRIGSCRSGESAKKFLSNLAKDGYQQKMYATFTGLTELPNEDAYCLTVDSDTHAWTVNGMITHNTEIMLHSSEEFTFSCILSSLNLANWDKIKGSDAAFNAMVFLDCLCSYFIDVSAGVPGLEKVREFTRKGRAVGLGVMGFGTYLQQKGIPYTSLEAQFLNDEIFKHIHDETLAASVYLADIFGESDWCEGQGVRNTHRTAVAPTKSTSLLMGGVSESVFPDPAMIFDAGSSVGDLRRITPVIYELMKARGVYSKETIDDIIAHVGSVQHVGWLSEEEKQVFLTAFEIPQDVILRYASQRQKHLCQGQSLNFFVPEDGCEETVSKLLSKVFLDENILSQYYIYSRSGVVVKDECLACSA